MNGYLIMLAITIAFTLIFAALVAVLSLTDTLMKARAAFWVVFEERAALDAGFVPQLEASETRLRQPLAYHPLHRTARRGAPARIRKSGFGGARRSNLGKMQAQG